MVGGFERISAACAERLGKEVAKKQGRPRPGVKPAHELETHIYFAEELYPELSWKPESIPAGVILHAENGLSFRFENLPKYFGDPFSALQSILGHQHWMSRMSIDAYGRVRSVRSKAGPGGFLASEARGHVNYALETYLRRKIVSPDEVAEFYEEEDQLDPRRVLHFAFTDTLTKPKDGHVGTPQTVIRIYDGSPFPGMLRQSLGLPRIDEGDGGHILPLERKFPGVIAHLRKEHGDWASLFELGRLAVSEELDNGLPAILREIARTFLLYRFRTDLRWLEKSYFVMRATRAGARLYVRNYGMKLIDPARLAKEGLLDDDQRRMLEASPYRYLESNAKEFLDLFLNAPGVN